MKYTVYRTKNAIALGLNMDGLTKRGIVPKKKDYGWYVSREIKVDDDAKPQDIVERIYHELLDTGWRMMVGDVVELDGRYWFINSIGVKEPPEFGKEG